jgi:hypothetical protein
MASPRDDDEPVADLAEEAELEVADQEETGDAGEVEGEEQGEESDEYEEEYEGEEDEVCVHFPPVVVLRRLTST